MMKRKPSLKEQFAQAKAFIQRQQYAEARALLRTIDHPTAKEWLAKLDKLAPEKRQPRGSRILMGCLLSVIACGALFALFPPRPAVPVAAIPTSVAAAATNDTATAAVIIDTPAPTITPTDIPPGVTLTNTPTPTITETIAPSATITDTPTSTITETSEPTLQPTLSIDAMAATGEAAIDPIRKPLEQFGDFQGIRNLSALMLGDGISVNIDANVAPADDNDVTMWRLLELVQGQINPISQIRVSTYNRDQLNSLWLWEDGKWSVTRLATGAIEEFSSPPSWMATAETGLNCPKNCSTAVAQGWTEQQAGQCSNLDRDGDGVACYGN